MPPINDQIDPAQNYENRNLRNEPAGASTTEGSGRARVQEPAEQERHDSNSGATLSSPRLLGRVGPWVRFKFWESWRFDRNPSIFDALTALAAVIGIYFLITQSRQTASAINEAREANRISQRSVQLTAEALEAGRDANRAEREAFRLDQRAWILASDVRLPKFNGPGRLAVVITIANVGRSPALNVAHEDFFYGAQSPGSTPPMFLRVCDGNDCSRINRVPEESIGPNVGRQIIMEKQVTEDDYARLRKGDIDLVVEGRIEYRDIFNVDHFTNYCYQTTIDRRVGNQDTKPTYFFIACIGRNRAT